jgi:hypothetical protein
VDRLQQTRQVSGWQHGDTSRTSLLDEDDLMVLNELVDQISKLGLRWEQVIRLIILVPSNLI